MRCACGRAGELVGAAALEGGAPEPPHVLAVVDGALHVDDARGVGGDGEGADDGLLEDLLGLELPETGWLRRGGRFGFSFNRLHVLRMNRSGRAGRADLRAGRDPVGEPGPGAVGRRRGGSRGVRGVVAARGGSRGFGGRAGGRPAFGGWCLAWVWWRFV